MPILGCILFTRTIANDSWTQCYDVDNTTTGLAGIGTAIGVTGLAVSLVDLVSSSVYVFFVNLTDEVEGEEGGGQRQQRQHYEMESAQQVNREPRSLQVTRLAVLLTDAL